MTAIGAAPPIGSVTRTPTARLTLGLAGLTLLFGLTAGALVAGGREAGVVALAVVLLPVLLWKRPYLAPAVLLFAALTVEQFEDVLGPASHNMTAKIPLFHGLGSLRLSPADLLLGAVLLLTLIKTKQRGAPLWHRTPVSAAVIALMVAVACGLAIGFAHGGETRVAFMETRPYAYLFCTYLVAAALLTSRTAVRAALWAIVLAGGFKAVQALYIFLSIRGMSPRPESVLGHEEALFFGVFIFLTLALWLFDVRGRLRTTATAFLPLVMAADLANSRRAAWLVLGSGLIVLAVVALRCLPARRLVVLRLGAVALVISAVYFPAFWNKSGGLAQPARAVRSIVAPSMRDASSDLYRVQENANLAVNIQQGGLVGKGFGVPIDYPLPIADIRDIDPMIDYVPHNGVLYVLMRMGLLGGVALWSLIAIGVIGACRLARMQDRELAVVGGVLACALIGYAMEGAVDQGFFFYRIAFVMGSLLGLAEAARRLARPPPRGAP